jgi:hypothetical protein
VTNPALSVDRYFKDYCYVVSSEEEARDVFGRLKDGLSTRERDMIAAGADKIFRDFTWAHRLEEVMSVIS